MSAGKVYVDIKAAREVQQVDITLTPVWLGISLS